MVISQDPGKDGTGCPMTGGVPSGLGHKELAQDVLNRNAGMTSIIALTNYFAHFVSFVLGSILTISI